MAPGYLPAAYSSIKKAGGLCIADEVQAGYARTGSHFWGFESHGVVPDIVTMAKVFITSALCSAYVFCWPTYQFLCFKLVLNLLCWNYLAKLQNRKLPFFYPLCLCILPVPVIQLHIGISGLMPMCYLSSNLGLD